MIKKIMMPCNKKQDYVVNRCEYKYLVNMPSAIDISDKVGKILPMDSYSNGTEYMVRSLYFDTPGNNDLFAKLDGYNIGKKLRIRTYDPDAAECKIELKSKTGIYRQKRSVLISRDEAENIIQGNFSSLLERGTEAALKIYSTAVMEGYRPVVLIEYLRRAFVYPFNDTRITLDYNVKSLEYYNRIFERFPPYIPCTDNLAVLEVKFNNTLPQFVADILQTSDLHLVSFSKYAEGRPALTRYT